MNMRGEDVWGEQASNRKDEERQKEGERTGMVTEKHT
jgi:hypothetical protein